MVVKAHPTTTRTTANHSTITPPARQLAVLPTNRPDGPLICCGSATSSTDHPPPTHQARHLPLRVRERHGRGRHPAGAHHRSTSAPAILDAPVVGRRSGRGGPEAHLAAQLCVVCARVWAACILRHSSEVHLVDEVRECHGCTRHRNTSSMIRRRGISKAHATLIHLLPFLGACRR